MELIKQEGAALAAANAFDPFAAAAAARDDPGDDSGNNLIAAGALYALLHREAASTGAVTGVELPDGPSNRLVVRFSFLKSAYRLTVERVPDDT
jgi:hypothetical protein